MTDAPSILNLAAYRFAPVADPGSLRERLLSAGRRLGVRGTILVAPEGLNAFVAGPAPAAHAMLAELRAVPGFETLDAKESWSAEQPFRRFKLKLKREIIRMNHPAIAPAEGRAPAVDAVALRRWLDQGHDDNGRPVVMLDTRNDFEVDHGRFAGAIDWRLRCFTEFPEAVRLHRDAFAGKTVVSYCTGGIRCEKAALYIRELGIEQVWQLDGGILKYFEETDGRHWQGNCFVFDERTALAPDLSPATD
jgi:UPF0176 protein